MRILDRSISVFDIWSIMTSISILCGISFLYGVLQPLWPIFLSIFSIEDLIISTIYSMIAIGTIGSVVFFTLVLTRDAFNILAKLCHRPALAIDSTRVLGVALVLLSAATFAFGAFAKARIGHSTGLTYAAPAMFFLVGLGCAAISYKSSKRNFIRKRLPSVPIALALVSAWYLFVMTPNMLGFSYVVYSWDGTNEMNTFNLEPAAWGSGSLKCDQDLQIIWVGSKATIAKCHSDLVAILGPENVQAWFEGA